MATGPSTLITAGFVAAVGVFGGPGLGLLELTRFRSPTGPAEPSAVVSSPSAELWAAPIAAVVPVMTVAQVAPVVKLAPVAPVATVAKVAPVAPVAPAAALPAKPAEASKPVDPFEPSMQQSLSEMWEIAIASASKTLDAHTSGLDLGQVPASSPWVVLMVVVAFLVDIFLLRLCCRGLRSRSESKTVDVAPPAVEQPAEEEVTQGKLLGNLVAAAEADVKADASPKAQSEDSESTILGAEDMDRATSVEHDAEVEEIVESLEQAPADSTTVNEAEEPAVTAVVESLRAAEEVDVDTPLEADTSMAVSSMASSEVATASTSSGLAIASITSSMATEAGQCPGCGKRMGLIGGLRGFGFREKGHVARCLARHGKKSEDFASLASADA